MDIPLGGIDNSPLEVYWPRPMKRKLKPRVVNHDDDAKIFSKELKEWRKRMGWSQARAAKHFGIKKRNVENYEQGQRYPQWPEAIRKLMATARAPKDA